MKSLTVLLLCFLPTLGYAQNHPFAAYQWACAEMYAYFSELSEQWAASNDGEETPLGTWILVDEDSDYDCSVSDEDDFYRD